MLDSYGVAAQSDVRAAKERSAVIMDLRTLGAEEGVRALEHLAIGLKVVHGEVVAEILRGIEGIVALRALEGGHGWLAGWLVGWLAGLWLAWGVAWQLPMRKSMLGV